MVEVFSNPPWEWIIWLLLWAGWAIALCGALIVIFAMLVGLIRGVARVVRPQKKTVILRKKDDNG